MQYSIGIHFFCKESSKNDSFNKLPNFQVPVLNIRKNNQFSVAWKWFGPKSGWKNRRYQMTYFRCWQKGLSSPLENDQRRRQQKLLVSHWFSLATLFLSSCRCIENSHPRPLRRLCSLISAMLPDLFRRAKVAT